MTRRGVMTLGLQTLPMPSLFFVGQECLLAPWSAAKQCFPKTLCVQDGIKQTEVDSYVAQQFRQADTDGDGQVTFEDFSEYYQAMSISRARLELRSTMGMEAEREHTICGCLIVLPHRHVSSHPEPVLWTAVLSCCSWQQLCTCAHTT